MSEPRHGRADEFAATPEDAARAKARMAAAFDTVRRAVSLQTHASGGDDPVAVAAVAANARLAMSAGSTYLLRRLSPATPPRLAEAVRAFAELLEDIAMNALAGFGNDHPEQAARLQQAELASERVAVLCN